MLKRKKEPKQGWHQEELVASCGGMVMVVVMVRWTSAQNALRSPVKSFAISLRHYAFVAILLRHHAYYCDIIAPPRIRCDSLRAMRASRHARDHLDTLKFVI